MAIEEFLPRAGGRVRLLLTDGSVHDGSFRLDLLSKETVSAFFYGDVRNISLPVHLIETMEPIAELALAS